MVAWVWAKSGYGDVVAAISTFARIAVKRGHSVCGDPSSKNGWANLCGYCWQRRAHSAVLCAIDGCGKVAASLGANSVYGVVVDATSTFPAYNKTCCQARAFVTACVGICRRKIDGQMCVFTAGNGGLT